MITITNKLVRNGEVVGYLADYDGLITPLSKKAMYFDIYFHELIASGYKFYNYNADDVTASNGAKIIDLPAADADEVTTEEDWLQLRDVEDAAFSDAECSKYYEVPRVVENILPESDDITIHTREEFIAYLEQCRRQIIKGGFCSDHRPINAFVSREALFSFDEIYSGVEVKGYLTTLSQRRQFKNYSEYEQLVEWLFRKGVLKTHTPTPIEFIIAYNTWGYDGIGDDCVFTQTKLAVDGCINLGNEESALTGFVQNRDRKLVLWDEDENLSYLDNIVPTADINRFNRERIVFGSDDELFSARRTDRGDFKYNVVRALVSDVTDRLYMTYVTKDGYTFNVRFAHNTSVVFNNGLNIFAGNGFRISSIVRGTYFTLDNIRSADDYYIWNLAFCKVADIIKKSTYEAPIRSSYDMLIKEGLSPQAAISWMARMIKYDEEESCKMVKDCRGLKPDYGSAFDFYNRPIEPAMLDKLNVTGEPNMDKVEFLDMVSSNLEDIISALPVGASLNSSKGQDAVMALQLYDNIKFVYDAINDTYCIGAYGDGMNKDYRESINIYIDLLISIVKRECGNNMNRAYAEDIINRFEEGGYINTAEIFKIRDNAYRGYLADVAKVRKARAEGAWSWLYCTKIYRENSNAPTSEQRPYLLECIKCTDRKLRTAIADCVTACIPSSFTSREAALARLQSDWIAAKLFYAILGGAVKEDSKTERGYELKVNGLGVEPFKAIIPENVFNAIRRFNIADNTVYITLYDYCRFELGRNGAFSLFLVNADVTPWSITPKQGYSIPTYNFFINFYRDEALQTFGQEYMTALATTKCRGNYPLSLIPQNKFIPDDYIDTVDMYDRNTISAVLDERMNETVPIYHQRWIWSRMNARDNSLVLKTIPLKQDVVWAPIATILGYEFPTENTYFDSNEIEAGSVDTYCANNMEVGQLQFSTEKMSNLLTAEVTTISDFNVNDYPYDTICSWFGLLTGRFNPSLLIYTSIGGITIYTGDGNEFISCAKLDRQTLESFAANNIMFKLNNDSFLVRSINGDYVLEVK